MKNECIAAAIAELSDHAVRDVEIIRGGKHYQIRFRVNGGPQRVITAPCTPSDWRDPENTRRDVRKILRADGVIDIKPDPAPPPRQPSRVELLEKRIAALERAGFSTNTPVKEAGKHE
jgi:hypothetical protein